MSSLHIEAILSEQHLNKVAAAKDIEFVSQFGSEHRRREALAWRAIVRREVGSGCNITYDEWGAPVVDTPNTYISVSHCDKFVAVIIADTPCAVDIESVGRNFERVAERYIGEKERQLCSDELWFAKVWCAKEALYKYHRIGGIDFIEDIKIVSYDATSQLIVAELPDHKDIVVRVAEHEGCIVASIG